MTTFSSRKFIQHYDLDFIAASHAGIHVGDMVWDAAGIIPPKFARPGAPRNVFNALEIVGELDAQRRTELQNRAADLPLVSGGMARINVRVDADHAGNFQFREIVSVATRIELDKISAFNFSNIKVRQMPYDMRIDIDRHLDKVKRQTWAQYDKSIRRSFIITELYYGSVSVSLETTATHAADVKVLTDAGFKLKTNDALSRSETYSMDANGVPFAMRTELARRFSS